MMGLIPHMLEEIENGIMAVADQSIFPSLLPAENIKKKIPQQTKISIMTPTVSAFQSPSNFVFLCLENILFRPKERGNHLKTFFISV